MSVCFLLPCSLSTRLWWLHQLSTTVRWWRCPATTWTGDQNDPFSAADLPTSDNLHVNHEDKRWPREHKPPSRPKSHGVGNIWDTGGGGHCCENKFHSWGTGFHSKHIDSWFKLKIKPRSLRIAPLSEHNTTYY